MVLSSLDSPLPRFNRASTAQAPGKAAKTFGRAAASSGILLAVCLIYTVLILQWCMWVGDAQASVDFEVSTPVLAFLAGSAMGSLANVLIFRLPRRLSLFSPRHSICAVCRTRLAVLDMIPVLSFMLLRGRCRYCQETITPRYLAVETLLGAVWALGSIPYLVETWRPDLAAGLMASSFAMLVAACIGIETRAPA